MATIGRADLIIVPKFDGLTSQMNRALRNAAKSNSVSETSRSAGKSAGGTFADSFSSTTSSGIAKSGAIIGAVSQVTSKAMDVVADHMNSAVARLDTLKNYSRIMQSSFGVDANEAQKSIDTMADRLSNLPTRLDAMASTVQGLYAATKDYGTSLTTATNVGLGLNDMLLAGGQSQAIVNAASEQFRQILAKGKPDMQDWRSLLQAAPGQMDQLAKYMLGATGTATQLYYALGGGNEKTAAAAGYDYATLSIQDLLNAIVTLDTEGGAGLESFQSQAEAAQGGVQTAMDNLSNSVTKGIEKVMESIGRENIVGVIDELKGDINDAFSGIADFTKDISPDALNVVKGVLDGIVSVAKTAGPIIGDVAKTAMPAVQGLVTLFQQLSPAIGTALPALMGFKAVTDVFGKFKGVLGGIQGIANGAANGLLNMAAAVGGGLGDKLFSAAGGAEAFAAALGTPAGVGIAAAATLAAGTLAVFIAKEAEAQQKQQEFNSAVSAFNSAIGQADNLDAYSGRVDTIGQNAQRSTEHLDNLTKTLQDNADTIKRNNDEAESTIATWQTIDAIIDESAGKTDLTVEQQGKLQWALDKIKDATGEQISMEDVLTGKFTDQAGAVQDLQSWIDKLAQSKIAEARTNALQSDLETAYSGQREAAQAMNEAYQQYQDVLDEHTPNYLKEANGDWELARHYAKTTNSEVKEAKKNLDNATAAYNNQTGAVKNLEGELGGLTQTVDENADAYSQLAANPLVSGAFGSNIQDFIGAMRDAGVNLDDFNAKLEENPQLMAQISDAFDGTKASIDRALSDAGVKLDETAQHTVTNAQNIQSTIEGMDLGSSLSDMGTSAEQLANKLTDVGVTADTVGRMAPSSFAALASSCAAAGGDVDELADQIQDLDAIGIADKDFTVVGNGLVECDGMTIDLNNQTIGDKQFKVMGDGLIECEGHTLDLKNMTIDDKPFVVTDDGTGGQCIAIVQNVDGQVIKNKVFSITANDNATGTISSIQRMLNTLHDRAVTVTTYYDSINRSGTSGAVRMGGSQIPLATGGIIIPRDRYHADGFIMRQPTVFRQSGGTRDIGGENGAEAVIPLTNRYYSQPFVDLIADGIMKRSESKSGPTYVANVSGITVQATSRREFVENLVDVIGSWEGMSRT